MFHIFKVPQEAAQALEQMGTKYKFWYSDDNNKLTLFKEGRPETGENWAEKIACELATLIEIPHAHYELATYKEKKGVICKSLVEPPGARLIHGNELLAKFSTGHEDSEMFKQRKEEHTIGRVLSYFKATNKTIYPPHAHPTEEYLSTALDFFIGYLMFDAWIANQDRHSENWGLIKHIDGNSYLAPSYDHGSSLGRNETDSKRNTILTTKDRGCNIEKYVTKARSALFNPTENKPKKAIYTIDAFSIAGRQNPMAAIKWQERLASIKTDSIKNIIDKIPGDFMTSIARNFTKELLILNKTRILNLEFKK